MASVDLFGTRPRRPPRRLLKVIDAGHSYCEKAGESWARIRCPKCLYEAEIIGTVTEIKNQACPKCSPGSGDER